MKARLAVARDKEASLEPPAARRHGRNQVPPREKVLPGSLARQGSTSGSSEELRGVHVVARDVCADTQPLELGMKDISTMAGAAHPTLHQILSQGRTIGATPDQIMSGVEHDEVLADEHVTDARHLRSPHRVVSIRVHMVEEAPSAHVQAVPVGCFSKGWVPDQLGTPRLGSPAVGTHEDLLLEHVAMFWLLWAAAP